MFQLPCLKLPNLKTHHIFLALTDRRGTICTSQLQDNQDRCQGKSKTTGLGSNCPTPWLNHNRSAPSDAKNFPPKNHPYFRYSTLKRRVSLNTSKVIFLGGGWVSINISHLNIVHTTQRIHWKPNQQRIHVKPNWGSPMGFPFRVLPGDEKTHHAEDFTGRSSLFNMKPTSHPGTQETACSGGLLCWVWGRL